MAKLAVIKTAKTEANVNDFIESVGDEQKKADTQTILKMMAKASKAKPKMWGSAIIGFGEKRYKSPTSGREVDWFLIGLSPRKTNLSLYFMDMGQHSAALKKLGKHKIGKGCLYINKLADVDINVLESMITSTFKK